MADFDYGDVVVDASGKTWTVTSTANVSENYYEATSDYTTTDDDVNVEYLSGTYGLSLHTPTSNKVIYAINSGTGVITLTGDGISEVIYSNECFELFFNGTNWIVR